MFLTWGGWKGSFSPPIPRWSPYHALFMPPGDTVLALDPSPRVLPAFMPPGLQCEGAWTPPNVALSLCFRILTQGWVVTLLHQHRRTVKRVRPPQANDRIPCVWEVGEL